jgi:hypothetical protein
MLQGNPGYHGTLVDPGEHCVRPREIMHCGWTDSESGKSPRIKTNSKNMLKFEGQLPGTYS